jgi:hypothetical protein
VGFVPENLSSLLGFSRVLRFTGTNPTKTEDELRFSGTNPTKTEGRTQVSKQLDLSDEYVHRKCSPAIANSSNTHYHVKNCMA